MTKQEVLEIVAKARSFNVSFCEETEKAIVELENPHYTVTLTGEFQVGKSTLLNKVMLGTDILLTEGVGLPTTAIPCKIVYAPAKELTVVYRDERKAPTRYFGDEVNASLLRSLTTAAKEEDRLALARDVRYVQLGLPVDELRTYSFFDTPGVNDPNVELIERTTAETLPGSDVVVVVVDAAKMLSEDAKQYLSRAVFSEGMTRVLVLASYKPQVYMSAEDRSTVLETIRAQLRAIDRGYVPVLSYTYDPEVDGDILRGPSEIMSALLKYLAENREIAKIDRLAYQLAKDIGTAAEALRASIVVSGKSQNEIDELNRKVEAVARNLDAQYNQSISDFAVEYARIFGEMESLLKDKLLDEVDANSPLPMFMRELQNAQNAAQMREKIPGAVQAVAPTVQRKLVEVTNEFKNQILNSMERISEKAVSAATSISISADFNPSVSGGWVGRINPKIARIVGGVVTAYFGGSLIVGAIVFFQDKIPVLKKLSLDVLIASILQKTLCSSFRSSLAMTVQNTLGQMNMASNTIKEEIQSLYGDIYQEKIAPYAAAIEKSNGSVLDGDALVATRNRIAELEAAVVVLSH